MKNFLRVITATVIALSLVMLPSTAIAATDVAKQSICEGSGGTWRGGECVTAGEPSVLDTVQAVTNAAFVMAGAVAVLMIIIGGIRYAISAGDQSAITAAKNTIMYAVIGLVIVVAAGAIVNFVIGAFGQ